jgi:uncharacterized membrane protein
MIGTPVRVALGTGALTAGAMGGVFFGFSTFIMRALRQLPPTEGIAAMQAINRAAPTPSFGLPLFGTAALGVGLGIHGLQHLDEPFGRLEVTGGAVYLAGVVLTMAFHVPRNDALDRLDPDAAGSAAAWSSFVREWTLGNHVRTATSLVAAGAWIAALYLSRGG